MGTALVTGASTGIGRELAWELAGSGHHLVLVARNESRLEQLAQEVRAVAGVDVEVLAADLATAAGREAVAYRVRDSGAHRPVGLLVNNAGFGLGQSVLDGDPEREQQALDVMVRSVLELSRVASQSMRGRGRGAILNVSSVAALTTMGTYAAHKSWVRVFTEGMAAELRGTGVTATVLCPGLVRTQFHRSAGHATGGWPDSIWIDAGRVARETLQAVRRGQVVVTPSRRYQVVSALLRVAPRRIVRELSARAHR